MPDQFTIPQSSDSFTVGTSTSLSVPPVADVFSVGAGTTLSVSNIAALTISGGGGGGGLSTSHGKGYINSMVQIQPGEWSSWQSIVASTNVGDIGISLVGWRSIVFDDDGHAALYRATSLSAPYLLETDELQISDVWYSHLWIETSIANPAFIILHNQPRIWYVGPDVAFNGLHQQIVSGYTRTVSWGDTGQVIEATDAIAVDASGGDVTLALNDPGTQDVPGGVFDGQVWRTDTSSHTVTIVPTSPITINGGTSFTVPVGGYVVVQEVGGSFYAFDLATSSGSSPIVNNSVLANVSGATATPSALSIAEQTLLGRITGGSVTGLTSSQVKTLLAIASGDVSGLGNAATRSVGTTTGTVAAGDDSRITGAAQKSSNLSDLVSASVARSNLSLGTAALSASTDFQPIDADLTAIAALTTTTVGRSLLVAADAAALRTILALGTAATSASSAFETAGAAAAAQAASQPLDSDLTAIAALTTTTVGRSLLAAADASALRTILALGTAATANTGTGTSNVILGNDARLSDTRTPTDNSVTSAKIVDGTIVDADINASAAIALSKLASDPLARANHTGTQLGSTISDIASYIGGGQLFNGLSGNYVSPAGLLGATAGSTLSGSANVLYFVPIAIPRAMSVDRIAVSINTASSGNSARAGIYSAGTDGRPSALILDCGTVSMTTISVQEITISQALSRGLVWLAVVANAAPGFGAVDAQLKVAVTTNSGYTAVAGLSQAFTYAALPASVTATGTLSRIPDLRVRIV